MQMNEAVMPGTPASVTEAYATLAERAKTRTFGLIEEDVIVLDTETTGLSFKDSKLIEISAARLRGREIVDRFDTFIHPGMPIPPEITKLTSITDKDVSTAPGPEEAVAALAEFVGGCPVIAHNATFDRTFIESVKGGVRVSDIWIDSLALSRVALPRLTSHKLSFLADLFHCDSVSHRACDDVDALCGVWRILLVALSDLPRGLCRRFADMHPEIPWSYRPIFSFLAGEQPDAVFSLSAARADVLSRDDTYEHVDADELPVLHMPSQDELETEFLRGGKVANMYTDFEPRAEQVEMSCEVREAFTSRTHRVIEAGTGVGKSIAYLLPAAEAARRNNVTVGIATKSNNLADQLIYHELPKLAEQYDGALSFCALKGYDHYPCLRKLERMSRGSQEISTTKDPADTLTAIAVIYAFVCQSPTGDLDGLGIRWKSVRRADLTTGSRECARRLCPFYPDKCLVHGARRRAARADIVVTNHSLLFRNVAAEGKILPPIRHWIVDEAHSMEQEARRQWARTVSADDVRATFERLGNERTGALGHLTLELASSDAATLYMGLGAKAVASTKRASLAMAELFEAVRELSKEQKGSSYDSVNLWIGPDLRASAAWGEFAGPAHTALDALDEASKNLASFAETVSKEAPDKAVDVADGARRVKEILENLRLMVEGTDERYVYSLQVNRRLRAGGESLTAELMDVGAALAETWLPEMHSVILTSATISIAGSFDHFKHAVGLDRIPATRSRTIHLDSSYNYDENMTVVVAGDVPAPKNREAYLNALEKLLVDVHIAMGGSTLTLFTNRRDMEELYARVQPRLAAQGLELACQQRNSSPRALRDRFISERSASLFALKAFWEGFDASGDTLRCVIIPKLPFSSPTDPLSLERDLREDRAWAQHSLPEAVLEVKQAAGRLIRTSTDVGVLVLADSRLVTMGYGQKFLKSLPTAGYQKIESAQVGRYLELWRRARG